MATHRHAPPRPRPSTQQLFGRSSEKRGSGAEGSPEAGAGSKKKTGHGPRPQAELDVVEREIDLDAADRTRPSRRGELEQWSGQAEESEEIDVLERRFVLTKVRRKKLLGRADAPDAQP